MKFLAFLMLLTLSACRSSSESSPAPTPPLEISKIQGEEIHVMDGATVSRVVIKFTDGYINCYLAGSTTISCVR